MTRLDQICSRGLSYDDSNKRAFHKEAKAVLYRLAQEMGIGPAQFDLRSNMGGIAVSGEITLHTESLYVQVYESATRAGTSVLVRACKSRKDYTGERNLYCKPELLYDSSAFRRFLVQNRLRFHPTHYHLDEGPGPLRYVVPAF